MPLSIGVKQLALVDFLLSASESDFSVLSEIFKLPFIISVYLFKKVKHKIHSFSSLKFISKSALGIIIIHISPFKVAQKIQLIVNDYIISTTKIGNNYSKKWESGI